MNTIPELCEVEDMKPLLALEPNDTRKCTPEPDGDVVYAWSEVHRRYMISPPDAVIKHPKHLSFWLPATVLPIQRGKLIIKDRRKARREKS